MKAIEKYEELLNEHGVAPLLILLDRYEAEQNFEECGTILWVIKFFGYNLPTKMSQDVKPLQKYNNDITFSEMDPDDYSIHMDIFMKAANGEYIGPEVDFSEPFDDPEWDAEEKAQEILKRVQEKIKMKVWKKALEDYGVVPLLILIDKYKKLQDYGKCAEILSAIKESGQEYPTKLTPELIESAGEFWTHFIYLKSQ